MSRSTADALILFAAPTPDRFRRDVTAFADFMPFYRFGTIVTVGREELLARVARSPGPSAIVLPQQGDDAWDGLALVAELRRQPHSANIPIIMVGWNSLRYDRGQQEPRFKRALAHGVTTVIDEPYEPSHLALAIAAAQQHAMAGRSRDPIGSAV